jgi:hypothetical protein
LNKLDIFCTGECDYTYIYIKKEDRKDLPEDTYIYYRRNNLDETFEIETHFTNVIDELDYVKEKIPGSNSDEMFFVQDVFASRFIPQDYAFELFPEVERLVKGLEVETMFYFILHKANIAYLLTPDGTERMVKELPEHVIIRYNIDCYCDVDISNKHMKSFFEYLFRNHDELLKEYNSVDATISNRDGSYNYAICESLTGKTFYAILTGD